jgi:hypothetical protein
MCREAKAIWRATTARFAPDFFAGAEFLLEVYCETAAMLQDVIVLIKKEKASEPVDYKRLAVLTQLQRAEAMVVARLSSSLRLSPKSRFDRYSVRPVPNLPKPWELGRAPPRGDEKLGGGCSPFDAE